jgi:hypothetical protein
VNHRGTALRRFCCLSRFPCLKDDSAATLCGKPRLNASCMDTCEAQSWVLANHVFAVCPQTPRDVTACLSRVESFQSKTPTNDSEARRRRTTPKQDADARLRRKTPTQDSEARRRRTTPKQDVLETWQAAESFLVDGSSFCRDHRDQTNAHN